MRLRGAREPGDPAARAVLAEARRGLALALGLSLALNLLLVALPMAATRLVGSDQVEALALMIGIAALALLALAGLEAVRATLLARLGSRLHRRLAPHLLAARLAPGGGPPPALESLRRAGFGPTICTALDAPWLPLLVAAIWLLHPWLGVLAAAGAISVLALALSAPPTPHLRRVSPSETERALAEVARHGDVVRAMGMAPALAQRLAQATAAAGDAPGLAVRAVAVRAARPALRLLALAAMVALGVLLALRHEINPAAVVAASILLGRMLSWADQLPCAWRTLLAGRAALDDLRQRLAAAPGTAMPIRAPAGRVELEGVTVAAPQAGPPLLRGIRLALQPGEVLGVAGPSAAGKSTLCRVLTGCLAPATGAARLDGTDLYGPAAATLGEHIGYLPQEVGLLAGTVRDNIARMAGADPARVVEAARLAGIHEMILRLPSGYETMVGEGGLGLSAGQRQRLGLARALYGRPCLVVLDEPAAHLDDGGESALGSAIATLRRWGAGVVVVSRSPSLLAHADRILVLRHGRQIDLGPRERVLQRLSAPTRAA